MYILHTRQTYTLFTTTTLLSHVRGGLRCHCPTESILYIQKDRLVQAFSPSPSRPLCPFTYAYRHTGERGAPFFSNGLSCSQMFTGEENDGVPTKIIRRLCVLSVRGKSFSLAFKSLLPLSSPSGLLSPDSWAASHSGHTQWLNGGYLFLPLSLTSSICCTCRPSSFLFFFLCPAPVGPLSTRFSFPLSHFFLTKESLRREEE